VLADAFAHRPLRTYLRPPRLAPRKSARMIQAGLRSTNLPDFRLPGFIPPGCQPITRTHFLQYRAESLGRCPQRRHSPAGMFSFVMSSSVRDGRAAEPSYRAPWSTCRRAGYSALTKHGEVLFLHLRCHVGESTTGDPRGVAGV
jgi:hypothetical protein